jgi:glycogen synthase
MLWSLRRAIERYSNSKAWNKILLKDMEEDFSWSRPAALYKDLYKSVL